MAVRTVCVVDNRDAQEMFGYLEARVEIMKRRIEELERENEVLRRLMRSEANSIRVDECG
jgi:cell division protein FtsB